jgi:hypothetical protein
MSLKLQGVKNFPTTLAELDKLFRGVSVSPSNDSVGSDQLKSNSVVNSKLRDSGGNTVIGRSPSSPGDPSDIAVGTNEFLVNRGGILGSDGLIETDIPVEIARSSVVTTQISAAVTDAIADHEAASNPHPQYTTAADVASAIGAALASGTYTPTLTNITNLDTSTAYQCQYMKVGTVVTVSGKVDVNPTAGASTQLGLSIPIASNFAASEDCAGSAFASGIAGQGAAILADVVNNRAIMQWVSVDTTNQAMLFSFTYRVI